MAYPKKVATCCYCGTRSVLVLRGSDRHELSCAQCGAPLHDLKMMPVKSQKRPGISHTPEPAEGRKVKRKKGKARMRRWLDVLDDAFELVEDIFD